MLISCEVETVRTCPSGRSLPGCGPSMGPIRAVRETWPSSAREIMASSSSVVKPRTTGIAIVFSSAFAASTPSPRWAPSGANIVTTQYPESSSWTRPGTTTWSSGSQCPLMLTRCSARIPGIGAWASMTSLKSLSLSTLADSATSVLCCARSTCHAERTTKQVTSTSTNSRDPNHLGVSAKRNRSDHRAGLVGRDSDVDALEFLEVEVAGRGQGPTQGADEVEFADRGASGTEEHLLEAADGAQFHSV